MGENIKDFSKFDLGKIEKLKLPKETKYDDMSKFGFAVTGHCDISLLDTSSMDKDAFIDLHNLKSLHIGLARQIPLDFRRMLNLKELCLQHVVYSQANLLISLEKLSLIDLNGDIDLEPLKALTELSFLEFAHVNIIVFNSSKPFDCFTKLTCLKLSESRLKFNATNSNDACNIINIGTER